MEAFKGIQGRSGVNLKGLQFTVRRSRLSMAEISDGLQTTNREP
jgi:hypothetical protein